MEAASSNNNNDEVNVVEDFKQQGTVDEEQQKRAQTEAQLNAIAAEVNKQPLTSRREPIATLAEYYTATLTEDMDVVNHFLRGALYLADEGGYREMRTVRGDGNCYIRAMLYALCETLIVAKFSTNQWDEKAQAIREAAEKLYDHMKDSLKRVVVYGYDESTIEIFYDEFMSLMEFVIKKDDSKDIVEDKLQQLHLRLNEESGTSDYCTWYMRVLIGAKLKSEPDRFMCFLTGMYGDIESYCMSEVEPMGKECEEVQVIALAEALGVKVVIEYLDGRDFGEKLIRHEFGGEESSSSPVPILIHLLYRPGHYDILYK